jgi:hypothetical protein
MILMHAVPAPFTEKPPFTFSVAAIPASTEDFSTPVPGAQAKCRDVREPGTDCSDDLGNSAHGTGLECGSYKSIGLNSLDGMTRYGHYACDGEKHTYISRIFSSAASIT